MKPPPITTLVAGLMLLASPACGDAEAGGPIRVANNAELRRAVEAAQGGETIMLAPGNYGDVGNWGRAFPSEVTLVSANASRPAHVDLIWLKDASNMTFRGLDVGFALKPGDPHYTKYGEIYSSTNIVFDKIHFHGSLDGDPSNDGWGLYVTKSTGIRVLDSEFEQLYRAAVFEQSTGIQVIRSKFHGLRSDGLDFAAVRDVVIDRNRFSDYITVPGDHPDAIQFWTNGQTAGSSDIRITNNEIFQGDGIGPQGIFMRDEVGGLKHRRIHVENNILYSKDQYEGISIANAEDVTIVNNSVLSPPDDEKMFWIRLEDVNGATVRGNVTDRYVEANGRRVTVSDNIVLSEQPAAARRMRNLRAGPRATSRDLTIEGRGFRSPADGETP